MDHQNPNLDPDKEELIQKMNELQRQLDKIKREKRNITDELNTLKIEKRQQQKKFQESFIPQDPNQENQILLKDKKDILNIVENEISSFSQFTTDINEQQLGIEEFHKSFETINQLSNNSHLQLKEKIPLFFTAVRSLVLSCLQQSHTLSIQDLDNERNSTIETSKLTKQLNYAQNMTKLLKKQITSEHKMIANFAKNFDPSAVSIDDDESFVQNELKILSDSMIVDYSKFKSLIERDFGQIDNDQISLSDLLEYTYSKFQEVDDFIQKLYIALEVDPNESSYDGVLNTLQQHLAVIPKLQNSTTHLQSENEILKNHCAEMEQIIQKQSQEFSKSHKSVVQKLQDQIKELQSRCNDTRLEEITQILSDKDQESQNLSRKISEFEESEIKYKEKISELNLNLIKQKKRNEELNSENQLSIKKLKEDQKVINQLKNLTQQKEMKIKQLEENLNQQIQHLTLSNEQLRYTAEEEQKTEIEELRNIAETSINELKKMKKKAKKFQNLYQNAEISKKELETKVTELNGLQEEQNLRISELQSRLKHSKVTMSQISDEYRSFQQEHLKVVSKLKDSQSKVKNLTSQNEFLSTQLNESQLSIESIESSSCPKKELEKCFSDIQSKEKTISELKSIVSKQRSTISAYESRQPILEQFRDKYSEEHENLRQKNNFVLEVTTAVKDIHYNLTMIFQNRPNASPTLIEILQKMKPLFNMFQLPLFSFDFVRPNSFSIANCRVVNLRPNADFEVLSQQHKVTLARISEELAELPINQGNVYSSMNSMASLTDRLRNILEMAVSAKKVFEEKNDSLSALTSLVKNQQSAMARMSHSTPFKT